MNLTGANANLPLYVAIIEGNRSKTLEFLRQNPNALWEKFTKHDTTPIHVAAATKACCILPMLVNMVPRDRLGSLLDNEQNTVLMSAAAAGKAWVAAILVNRTKLLLTTANNLGSTPLLEAADYGNKRMVRYLLSYWEEENGRLLPQNDLNCRVKFVRLLLVAGFYDLALYVIEKLEVLETQNIVTNLSLPQCYESFLELVAATPVSSSFWAFQFWAYKYYVQVIKSICQKISRSGDFLRLKKPLLLAAELGVQEVVEEILKTYPDAIWFSNDEGHNIYHLSVIHRHEHIFGLLNLMHGYKNSAMGARDNKVNNILHLVAKSIPLDRMNVCGPALRIQSELKWYKEVKKRIQPSHITEKNIDQKTPSMIFTEERKDLIKAGEKWMKGAATAGSVAATLIATVVFTAAINVPGGSKDNDGSPNYATSQKYHAMFNAFIYADGLALFLSISSVIMFMSILASGFSQSDFDNLVANRLIFGLLTLLLSLTSMLVAFWFAFLLATQSQLRSTVGWALLQVTYIPGFLFLYLFYPLLSQMIRLTWLDTNFHPRSTNFLQKYLILPPLCWVEHVHMTMVRWLCYMEVLLMQAKETLLSLSVNAHVSVNWGP